MDVAFDEDWGLLVGGNTEATDLAWIDYVISHFGTLRSSHLCDICHDGELDDLNFEGPVEDEPFHPYDHILNWNYGKKSF